MSYRKALTKFQNEIHIFESQKEILEYTDPTIFDSRNNTSHFVGREFKDWEDVMDNSRAAWVQGISIMDQYSAELRDAKLPEIKSSQRKTTYNDSEGDEMDFERMITGQAAFKKTERETTHGPTEITVFIDTTTPCTKQSNDILWRGAAGLALVELLEKKGCRVELWVVNGSKLYRDDCNRGVMTACCLKRTSDTMDRSTMVNVVSGWFYRTATFALLSTICAKEQQRINYGFGSCHSPTAVDLDELSRDQIRVYSSGTFSKQGALDVIIAELQRIKDLQDCNEQEG